LNRDASYTEPRWFLGWSLLWTAEALGRSDRPALAVENYRKVLSMWEAQDQAILQAIVAGIHVRIGKLLAKTDSADQAAQEYQRALSIAEQLISKYPYLLEAGYARAESCLGLGELSRRMAESPHRSEQQRVQDWTKARNWYQRSVDAWQRIQNPGAITPMGFACDSPRRAAQGLAGSDAALANLRALTR
jgi:tetratricopeptide (TPR) repeat protein